MVQSKSGKYCFNIITFIFSIALSSIISNYICLQYSVFSTSIIIILAPILIGSVKNLKLLRIPFSKMEFQYSSDIHVTECSPSLVQHNQPIPGMKLSIVSSYLVGVLLPNILLKNLLQLKKAICVVLIDPYFLFDSVPRLNRTIRGP